MPPPTVTGCPDDEELALFVERALAEGRRAKLEVHCESCKRCRDTVGLLVATFSGLRGEVVAR